MRRLLLILLLAFSPLLFASAPLKVNDAFQLSTIMEGNTLFVEFQIAQDHYLYADKLHFQSNNSIIEDIEFDSSTKPSDVNLFGAIHSAYQHAIMVQIHLKPLKKTEPIAILYQGCSTSSGICYPPQVRTIKIKPNGKNTIQNIDHGKRFLSTPEQHEVAGLSLNRYLTEHNLLLVVPVALLFGLLLAFTPCILPMIPILSGLIVGSTHLSSRQAFSLSLSYVLAMSATYAGLGIAMGIAGNRLQAAMQNPWTILGTSLLFLLLALSLFGFYELRLPERFSRNLQNLQNQQPRGRLISAAIMGAISALIVSPCISAPLAGVLIYIAQTGDALLGGSALFFLGLGIGTPLLFIGFLEGKLIPRSGAWMLQIKYFFGVVLILTAIWLSGGVLPAKWVTIFMCLTIIAYSIYLGVFHYSPKNPIMWCRKILAILLFVVPVIYLTSIVTPSHNATSRQSTFQTYTTLQDVQQALNQAKQNNKPVLLDFYAQWCAGCRVMDEKTFTDPKIKDKLKDYIWVKADITDYSFASETLLNYFHIPMPPAVLLFNKNGKEQARLIGEVPSEQLLNAADNQNGLNTND